MKQNTVVKISVGDRANASAIFKLIFGFALCVASVFTVLFFFNKSLKIGDRELPGVVQSRNVQGNFIQEIARSLHNNNPEEALRYIDEIEKYCQEKKVLEYYKNFKDYYRKNISKDKSVVKCVDTLYFIENSIFVKDYLKKNGLYSINDIEALPYYCIKYYTQNKSGLESKKNISNLNLYDKFVRIFIETESENITTKEADIICLYLSAKKHSLSNSDNDVKLLQAEIQQMQQDYKDDLGEHGRLTNQRDVLKKMDEWCKDKVNEKFPKYLFVGAFPAYRIPVENR